MMIEECLPGIFLETQELNELLRKDVMRPHIKPGGGPHFINIVPCFRNPSKIAVGDETKLVIVVEDHPAMSRQAKILEQQITRKDIAECQVADGLPIVDSRSSCGFLVGLSQKQV